MMGDPVRRQVVLPWKQVVRIAYNSLRVRLFRSLIITLTLVLAIAFLVYLWSGSDILNSIWPDASKGLQQKILDSGYEPIGSQFGTGPKDRWLAILSLLVCVVGIINAQLMAVTERFQEIGTLKCLGALDSFIVKMFVLEALYQGVLGGLAGSLLGIFVASLTFTIKFGWVTIIKWPFWAIMLTCCYATLLAMFLSLMGVIYPALVAARMQPAMALRTEQ